MRNERRERNPDLSSLPRGRLAPVISRAPLPMVELHGPTHVVAYANSAFCTLLGKTRQNLVGKSFIEIVPGADRCLPLLEKVYQTGLGMTHQFPADAEDDSASWLYALWPALDPNRKPVGVIIQLAKIPNYRENITAVNEALLVSALRQQESAETAKRLNVRLRGEIAERRKAEASLREQEKLLRMAEKMAAAGQLAACLAHEINNPLASVTNVLFLLESRHDLNDSDRALLQIGTIELARVARIVKHSLSHHQIGVKAERFDLAELVRDSIDIFHPRLQNTSIRLTQNIESHLSAYGHPGEVRQVIDNLILNSLDALPPEGRLSIAVHASIDWRSPHRKGARFTIADSGSGIAPENRSQIFEPFFTTKAERGNGLGLWVLKGIIARHEGTISMRTSQAQGKSGTAISVFLPSQLVPVERSRASTAR